MKKTFEVIGFLSLILFTFFYTSKITTVIKENDDLLIQLKEYQEQYKESAIDAVIIDNKISAGLSGSEINIKESYEKMKKVNSFNANLLVYEKIKPNISVLDYHDKYIVKGKKESVSLVFLVEQTSNIEKILNILDNYDVKATFYIDGNWFENNNEKVIELIENNHTVGNLGYNYNYDVNGVSWMNTIVTNIGKQKYTYCYLEEENDAFNLSEEMKKLAGANLNITDALKLFSEYKNLPLNLKRLNILQKERTEAPSVLREKYALKFPVEKVVLCEGITEEILLPGFAKIYGYDFNRFGVHLISAGGKNQVAKLYCELKEELKIPVFILLDADAKQISEVIASVLRQHDVIYLIKHGEFEDIFPLTLIRRTINNSFKNILKASVNDFKRDMPMTKTLADYYRENRLGDFQKADFAKQIYENLHSKKDLSDEIAAIVDMIAGL